MQYQVKINGSMRDVDSLSIEELRVELKRTIDVLEDLDEAVEVGCAILKNWRTSNTEIKE